jgi:radical SAM protein with 4Fe4S-binding SPASM domain
LNFILTNKCNNTCKFCFSQKNEAQLKYSNFKKIFNLYLALTDTTPKTIGILGGEPTLHDDFFKILKYSVTNSDKISRLQLFTNCNYPFYYNKKILETIKLSKCEVNISCNLSQKNELSEKNLHYLLENFTNTCLSITLYSDNLSEYEYVLKYKEKYNLKYIRIAIANNKQLFFIRNRKLQTIIEFFINNNFEVTWDSCGYFTPCMFDDYEKTIPLLDKISFISHPCFMCTSSLDITPEGNIIPCLGHKNNIILLNNFYLKMDLPEISTKLQNKYNKIIECFSCPFNNVCKGICSSI